VTKASGTLWASQLELAAAQPPPWRSSWSSCRASPLLLRGCTTPAAAVAEEDTAPAAAVAEGAAAAEVQEEAPAEAGLVDIASILGAQPVTVVRSTL
jgi:hypothetical protein